MLSSEEEGFFGTCSSGGTSPVKISKGTLMRNRFFSEGASNLRKYYVIYNN